jgi:hypothetical protein
LQYIQDKTLWNYTDAFIFIYEIYSVVESFTGLPMKFFPIRAPASEGDSTQYFAQLYKDALHEYMNVRETIKPQSYRKWYEDFKNSL